MSEKPFTLYIYHARDERWQAVATPLGKDTTYEQTRYTLSWWLATHRAIYYGGFAIARGGVVLACSRNAPAGLRLPPAISVEWQAS